MIKMSQCACCLGRSESFTSTGFFVGNKLSIADIQLFDLVDLHLRPACSPDHMQAYPNLLRLHSVVAGLPRIKEFVESDKRPAKVNGNNLG